MRSDGIPSFRFMNVPGSVSPQLENDPLPKILQELQVMRASHRLCVIAAHGLLELLINTFVEANCKHGKDISSRSRDYTHSAKLVILHELSLITDSEFRQFDWFRKLRNRAAHDPLFEITSADLDLFRGSDYSNPDNFYMVCINLIGGFWNRHVTFFAPKFLPSLFPKTET